MEKALAFLEKFVFNTLTGHIAPTNPDRVARKVLTGLLALFYIATNGLIIWASYISLSNNFSFSTTLFLMSAVTFSFMLINAGIMYSIAKFKQQKIKEANDKLMDLAEKGLRLLEDEITYPIVKNPKTSILVSALSGYFAGETLVNANIANDTRILTEKIRGTYIKR